MSDKKGILIVDDEAILLLSIRQELRFKFGGEFVFETALSAEKGLAAIGKLEAEGVDTILVISDWLMPGMRGDEFLTRIHADHPAIRLVMLSGHADVSQMEELAKRIDLFGFLRKPYSSPALYEIVSRALASARPGPRELR
jgi:DNA-binding NtrC family response regulator